MAVPSCEGEVIRKAETDMKICTKCGEEKSLTEFYYQKDGSKNRTCVCKKCKREAARIIANAVIVRAKVPTQPSISDKLYVNCYRGDSGREYVSAMTYDSAEEAEEAFRRGPVRMEWIGVCELSKPVMPS